MVYFGPVETLEAPHIFPWLLAGKCRAVVMDLLCGAELRDGTLLFTFGSAPTASSGAGQAVGTTTPPKAESSAQAASLPAEDVDSSKQEYPATAPQAASAAQYAIVPEKEHPLETSAPAQPADVSTAAAAAGLAPASAAADVNATPGAALIQCLNDMTVRVSGLNLPAPEVCCRLVHTVHAAQSHMRSDCASLLSALTRTLHHRRWPNCVRNAGFGAFAVTSSFARQTSFNLWPKTCDCGSAQLEICIRVNILPEVFLDFIATGTCIPRLQKPNADKSTISAMTRNSTCGCSRNLRGVQQTEWMTLGSWSLT